MFLQVNYIIDDGYDWDKHVCVVVAESIDEAILLVEEFVKKFYTGNDEVLLNRYTVVTKLPENGIIFNK